MAGRFQFSMRRLFVIVSALCIAAWLISRVVHGSPDDPSTEIAELITVVAAFGGAITASVFALHFVVKLTGRPSLGAVVATCVLLAGTLAGIVFLCVLVAARLR